MRGPLFRSLGARFELASEFGQAETGVLLTKVDKLEACPTSERGGFLG
jgi:hypothetical protein